MEGQKVSHCRTLEKIGKGDLGQISLIVDTSLEQKVALRSLPSSLQTDPVPQRRLMLETRPGTAIKRTSNRREDWGR